MHYETVEQGLGIVILGQFNPLQTSIDWLVGHQVIKEEEREQSRQNLINENVSVFNVGNIRLLCDKDRFQVGTTDVVAIPRILSFCRDLLDTVDVGSFRGIGVNPHLVIRFPSLAEKELFENRMLPPMATWRRLCDTGQVGTITVNSGNKTVALVRTVKKSGRVFYSFNVNVHYEMHGVADILTTIDNAQQIYYTEMNLLDTLIKSI